MPRREVIYNGGGSVLREKQHSETLRFSTYDDAEEPQCYPASITSKTRRNDASSFAEARTIRGASEKHLSIKKASKSQEDLELKQKISRQRAFLLQLSDCDSLTARVIPDRIVRCLREEIKNCGGLKEWADIQRLRNRTVGARLAQEAKDWMKKRN